MAYLPTLTLSFSRLKWEMEKKKLKNMYLSLGEHASPVTFLTLPPLKFVTCTSPPPVTSSPPPLKKQRIFQQRGGGVNLLHIRPQHLLRFNPPPLKKQQIFQKREGGVKIVNNTWPTLVTFFTPPSRYQNLTIYMAYIKKSYCNLHFSPPP